MLHQGRKCRAPHRHDWQRRLRCASRNILIAKKAERVPQALRWQGLTVGGIGGDSRRYDNSPETLQPLDFVTAGRAAASEGAEWISPLRAICPRLR